MARVRRAHLCRSHTLSNGCGRLSCKVIMMLPGSKGGSCEFAVNLPLGSARVGSSCVDGTLAGRPGGAAEAAIGFGVGILGAATVAAGVGDGRPGAPPATVGCTGEASATLGAGVDTEDAGAAVLAADGVAATHALATGAAAARTVVAVLVESGCAVGAEAPGGFASRDAG